MLEKAVKYAKELCDSGGHKLLYLIKYGSHLYGTNTPASDLDVVGIYAPSFKSLITLDAPKTLHYTSGNNHSKNSNDDIDIKLYSIQYFILNKIKNMDINALDLFFSINSPNVHIYKDPIIDELYSNRNKILSTTDIADISYLQYARKQVKKYGLKGTKVWVYLKICNWIEDLVIDGANIGNIKLMDIHEDLMMLIEDDKLISLEKEDNGFEVQISQDIKLNLKTRMFLRVVDQLHDLGITVKEFYKRTKLRGIKMEYTNEQLRQIYYIHINKILIESAAQQALGNTEQYNILLAEWKNKERR